VSLVQDQDGILRNIAEFSASLNGSLADRSYAAQLVRKGHVYYPFTFNGALGFAPSKFIGYDANTIKKYRNSTRTRSGSKTTAKISRILRQLPQENQRRESELRAFCASLGVELADYRHSFWQLPPVDVGTDRNSAIDDLHDGRTENEDPRYRDLMSRHYVRNDKIRAAVKRRANGQCEWCSATAFVNTKGDGFIECHHIVSLSAGGEDSESNVIGLCPNHHREAHLGEDWEALNRAFEDVLKNKIK